LIQISTEVLLGGGLLHLVQQGGDWAGSQPTQSPPYCTKCNSPVPTHQRPVYQSPHCCIMARCSAVLTWPLNSFKSIQYCHL